MMSASTNGMVKTCKEKMKKKREGKKSHVSLLHGLNRIGIAVTLGGAKTSGRAELSLFVHLNGVLFCPSSWARHMHVIASTWSFFVHFCFPCLFRFTRVSYGYLGTPKRLCFSLLFTSVVFSNTSRFGKLEKDMYVFCSCGGKGWLIHCDGIFFFLFFLTYGIFFLGKHLGLLATKCKGWLGGAFVVDETRRGVYVGMYR
jgi:hypothetical protein